MYLFVRKTNKYRSYHGDRLIMFCRLKGLYSCDMLDRILGALRARSVDHKDRFSFRDLGCNLQALGSLGVHKVRPGAAVA